MRHVRKGIMIHSVDIGYSSVEGYGGCGTASHVELQMHVVTHGSNRKIMICIVLKIEIIHIPFVIPQFQFCIIGKSQLIEMDLNQAFLRSEIIINILAIIIISTNSLRRVEMDAINQRNRGLNA